MDKEGAMEHIAAILTALAHEVHSVAIEKGWYDPPKSFAEAVVMMHTELSEAIDEARHTDDYTQKHYEIGPESLDFPGKPCGVSYELADCIIRILDTCAYYGIDIGRALIEKHEYNKTRPYRHGNKKL